MTEPDARLRGALADAAAGADGWRWLYRALFIRALDGDTIEVLLERGKGKWDLEQIRVAGVNTPEDNAGLEAKAFTASWCQANGAPTVLGGKGSPVTLPGLVVDTLRDTRSFTRYVGHVYGTAHPTEPVNLADALVDAGHAVRV